MQAPSSAPHVSPQDKMDDKTRYCFNVTWYDAQADLNRDYEFFFYPLDQTIEMVRLVCLSNMKLAEIKALRGRDELTREMRCLIQKQYDIKLRRTFLKRSPSTLRLEDLFVGASINVHARQLAILELGDEFTRSKMAKRIERAMLFIKPAQFNQSGQVLDKMLSQKFTLSHLRAVTFSDEHALTQTVLKHVVDGKGLTSSNLPSLVADFVGENVYAAVSKLAAADSGLTVPISMSESHQLSSLVFGKNFPRSAQGKNCTLAIIRPHAIVAGQAGAIIAAIHQAGFRITDAELTHIERANAEEFLEVYKGILPEYHLIVDQMTSGLLLAMEIVGADGEEGSVVSAFRDFVGPNDPSLAVALRPNSIRAKFGMDKVLNALHCTDLPEDGSLESQYFFQILLA